MCFFKTCSFSFMCYTCCVTHAQTQGDCSAPGHSPAVASIVVASNAVEPHRMRAERVVHLQNCITSSHGQMVPGQCGMVTTPWFGCATLKHTETWHHGFQQRSSSLASSSKAKGIHLLYCGIRGWNLAHIHCNTHRHWWYGCSAQCIT
jgi:hypothetical protein